jgi:hypothetical protein
VPSASDNIPISVARLGDREPHPLGPSTFEQPRLIELALLPLAPSFLSFSF